MKAIWMEFKHGYNHGPVMIRMDLVTAFEPNGEEETQVFYDSDNWYSVEMRYEEFKALMETVVNKGEK